jgi:hypothetical protein
MVQRNLNHAKSHHEPEAMMTSMHLIPVFPIYEPESAAERMESILKLLRSGGPGSEISLAVRTTLSIIEHLPGDIRQQLMPFLESKRLALYPDGNDGAFHGLMSEHELARELQSAELRMAEMLPGQALRLLPRWHDFHRPEAAKLYCNATAEVLLPGGSPEAPGLFIAENDLRSVFPAVYINEEVPPKRVAGKLMSHLRRMAKHITAAAETGSIHDVADYSVFLFFDAHRTASPDTAAEILSMITEKGFSLSSGYSDLKPLRYADSRSRSEEELPQPFIPPRRIACPRLDPPRMTPAFLCQLLPDSFPKKLKRSEMSPSVFSPLKPPDQRVEKPRPPREITSHMQGRAVLNEQDLSVVFERGNLVLIRSNAGELALSGGIRSRMISVRQGREKPSEFELESAFALEGRISRGLRQTLKLADAETQISGRIVNDFLQIEDSPELIVDSYIQHPWIREEFAVEQYIPQMFEIWDDVRGDELVDLRSANSDGSERNYRFRPTDLDFDTRGETLLLLPGMSWIVNRGPRGLGFELVHAARQKIDLPSAVMISRRKRDAFAVSFLPTGHYVRPETGCDQRPAGALQPADSTEPAQDR